MRRPLDDNALHPMVPAPIVVRDIDTQMRIDLPLETVKALGADVGDYVSLTICGDVLEVCKVKLP